MTIVCEFAGAMSSANAFSSHFIKHVNSHGYGAEASINQTHILKTPHISVLHINAYISLFFVGVYAEVSGPPTTRIAKNVGIEAEKWGMKLWM
jgi:hypothetical protein